MAWLAILADVGAVLALGIARARDERTIPTRPFNELPFTTLRAFLSRGFGLAQCCVALDVLALGVPRAAGELPIAAGSQLKRPAAVRTHFLQQLRLRRLAIWRQRAAELALGVSRAAQERSIPARFVHEVSLLAQRADLVGVGRCCLLSGGEHLLQRAVEVADHRHPLLAAPFDLIEPLFQACRVAVIRDGFEVLDHDRVHGLPDLSRVEPSLLDLHVPVIFGDRLDDRRVGGRPPDATLLQLLDQRRLRVTRRRLAEVLLRLDAVVLEILAGSKLGELRLAAVVALPYLVEAVEREHRAIGAKDIFAALDLDLRLVVHRRRHPAGHEPPPDQVVELELVRAQVPADRFRGSADLRRPDRLVCVLRARARLGRSRAAADILLAEALRDEALHLRVGLGRDPCRVRSHVGDQSHRAIVDLDALVQLLGDPHGVARAEAQAAGRVLLEGGGDVGSIRGLGPPLLLHAENPVGRSLQRPHDGVCLSLRLDLELGLGVGTARNTPRAVEAGQETTLVGKPRELDVNCPRLDGDEFSDLLLAVAYQSQRDRRHPPRSDPFLHLAPQKGAEPEADQTVDDPSRLLSVDEPHVDVARRLQGFADSLRCDLVELDPLGRAQLQHLSQMPSNRLPLPIRVGGQDDFAPILFDSRLQVGDRLPAAFDHLVVRLETGLDLDAQLVSGQVADVTHRGKDIETVTQEPLQSPRLGGGFDDDQPF